jgi:thioredoxin reductase (NADPH)
MEKLVIIGSGPAGLTAAIYAARADLAPLVAVGHQPGGQLVITAEVENFPGFPEGILGAELMANMRRQAERFGARFAEEEVNSVDFGLHPFQICTDQGRYETGSVVIATGAAARWIGIPGERRLIGRGVSSCATCDAFFFRNREVVVVGGGDTAMEEALFLAKFASRVTIIHRRDQLRASKILQDRCRRNPKIAFLWDTVPLEVLGAEKVEGVRVRNVKSGAETDHRTDGLFVAIGHTPNTRVFDGQLELDTQGYVIITKGTTTGTSVPGVFVAGDVADPRYRQAIVAAGNGARAAMDAEVYIEGVS